MKHTIVFLFIILFSFSCAAQDSKKDIVTDSFSVSGNCYMCKKRIEEAAYIKGVKLASWNEETQMLSVVYRPSKTTAEAIMRQVAHAGHDAGRFKATEEEYGKLPECCAYKTRPHSHGHK